jgi:glycosyltransferase involved in cell wall biosynthesis
MAVQFKRIGVVSERQGTYEIKTPQAISIRGTIMIKVFIPFRNVGSYLHKAIASVQDQTLKKWTVYLFDDNSDDESGAIARAISNADDRFAYYRNNTRHWLAGNLFQFSRMPDLLDSDIVVQLDGDDWFYDGKVLERVARAYEDPEVWITYGNFVRFQSGTFTTIGYCKEPRDFSMLRALPWTTSALRTFYVGLLRKIRMEEFLGPDGMFLCAASDLATMFPMLEMAGRKHSRCLAEINYVYNMDNPGRTPRVRKAQQEQLALLIRGRFPYKRLSKRDW